ncbi:MAG: gephyrin-like molybdotransferase Glp [Candidatus Acidiferrales bacterium]
MAAIGFDEALRTILADVHALEAETIALAHALGRVSAGRVLANEDAVPFPRSGMDGYAVRAHDCALARPQESIQLPIAGEVFAEEGESTLAAHTAVIITTGAPLPIGADAVIPHELTERHGGTVEIFGPVRTGDCVFPPGEDLRRGDELVATGQILNAGKLALLAFAGESTVRVTRRPRVVIICTGNELVDAGTAPARGQVRNSNAVAIHALVLGAGGEPRYQGVARDDRAALIAMLEKARVGADLLVTTGGASAGERDMVKRVLTELGAEFRFTEVAMRPGRPFGFAVWRGIPVCVLPGNPAAAFVCFQKLVRPVCARLLGHRAIEPSTVNARLDGELKGRPSRRYFVLARLRGERSGFVVKPLPNQCSALVRTAADANAIITVRETGDGSPSTLARDCMVEVEVFDWPSVFGLSREMFSAKESVI